MFNDWKQRLTTGWSLIRLVRLGLAFMVLAEAWKNSELLFALLGTVLLFQSVLNVGCCGSGACDIDPETGKTESAAPKEIHFTEIK
jgi:hypothetical protein